MVRMQPYRRVTNQLFRRMLLESIAAESESLVVEKQLTLRGTPKYRRTRGTRWEAGRTTFQG